MKPTTLLLTILTAPVFADGPTLPYTIVDSGQTACYDAAGTSISPASGQPFFGQDGNFQGVQPGYKDSGGGTTTDMNTGLTWIRKPPSEKYPWSDAAKVAAALNAKNFGGHNDWRLPSVKELYSIVHHGPPRLAPAQREGVAEHRRLHPHAGCPPT